MEGLRGEVVSEAVELSKAVFSKGREGFDESYEGELDGYLVVEDLRNRIEDALIDTPGDFPYLEELPDFSDLGYKTESIATIFYSISPDSSQNDFWEVSDISYDHISEIVSKFDDEDLVSLGGRERNKKYFYGENALPYLMLYSEAENIIEQLEEPEEYEESSKPVENSKTDETIQDETGEVKNDMEDEGGEKSHQDIMMQYVDDEEDYETTFEQEDDPGIDAREHLETDSEESSNPEDDEYYEGW